MLDEQSAAEGLHDLVVLDQVAAAPAQGVDGQAVQSLFRRPHQPLARRPAPGFRQPTAAALRKTKAAIHESTGPVINIPGSLFPISTKTAAIKLAMDPSRRGADKRSGW